MRKNCDLFVWTFFIKTFSYLRTMERRKMTLRSDMEVSKTAGPPWLRVWGLMMGMCPSKEASKILHNENL